MTRVSEYERLLAIIGVQNRIAAEGLDLEAVIELVVGRAQTLTGADAVVLELGAGDEMEFAGSAGTVTAPGGAQSMVSAPVLQEDREVGALKLYSADTHAFERVDLETLELLGGVVAAHLTRVGSYEDELDNSRRDPLTGLGNRRAYEERLAAECSRARRHGDPLTLCLLDLDGFRRVNDEHGEPAGDEILRQVADTLGRLRTEDMAFRIGDDEFAVILPATTAAQAAVPVERLTEHVKSRSYGAVSVSFGLADGPPDPADLHTGADAELLAAKSRRQSAPAR
jgi:diguanylate cyclase (GGDEF)-like protein